MKYSIAACILATCVTAANAQLYSFPAPPMTVADCQGGRIWMKRNGLATCDFYVPDPPPPPPPPPPCRYEFWKFMVAIGPGGNCSADGGCDGYGYAVYDGAPNSPTVARTWTSWDTGPIVHDPSAMWPLIQADMQSRGYYPGAIKTSTPGNGNYPGTSYYEVCRY
ncbi:conserved exported hypothetical protein [Cupriavidus taiwanensis]|uniref:Secreted protein n=1 Tax=Cupriavidus taiwanensis TaxID=164546 RepID=A0A375JE75_9BURK|nr:conserved exported hypothetical protein [Cupriavidus taiwanensis]